MPSRSVRRRRHKELARLAALPEDGRVRLAARLLAECRAEARRRAVSLARPAAWALLTEAVEARALALDRSGDLLADLERVIAQEVARAAGEPLVGVSRPVADRVRVYGRPS